MFLNINNFFTNYQKLILLVLDNYISRYTKTENRKQKREIKYKKHLQYRLLVATGTKGFRFAPVFWAPKRQTFSTGPCYQPVLKDLQYRFVLETGTKGLCIKCPRPDRAVLILLHRPESPMTTKRRRRAAITGDALYAIAGEAVPPPTLSSSLPTPAVAPPVLGEPSPPPSFSPPVLGLRESPPTAERRHHSRTAPPPFGRACRCATRRVCGSSLWRAIEGRKKQKGTRAPLLTSC